MESLSRILNRFMRLLPFVTAPNSYRRFYYDLCVPYPDIWSESASSSPTTQPAPQGRAVSNPPAHTAGDEVRPSRHSVACHEIHTARQEPFC